MYEAQDALVARADLLLAVRELARPDDMEPLAVDPKSSTSGVAGGAPRRPPPMTHRESIAEASESLMPEIACTSATAQGQHPGDQQVDDEGLDAVLHGMLSGNRALHFGHSSARRDLEHDVVRRSTGPSAPQAATVFSTMVLRRLSPICRFGFGPLLPARSCPSVTAADRSSGSCVVFSRRTTMRMTRITASSATLPAAPRSWPLRTPRAPPVAITRPCASLARRLRDAFPHTDHAEAGAPEAAGTARSSPSIQSSPLAVPVVLDDRH